MKKKKILLILILIILSISYIFIFTKYSKRNETSKLSGTSSAQNKDVITVNKAIDFMNQYNIKYLDTLNITFSSIEDIDNQLKLKYVFYSIEESSNFELGVSYTKFKTFLEEVFGSDIKLTNEDVIENDEILLSYDSNNETYLLNKDFELSTLSKYYSYYDYIVSFENHNNEYVLMVNKFFFKDNKVYSNYGDLQNDLNSLFEVPITADDNNLYIKNYVNTNYNELKSNLLIYKYTFVKENGTLILKSLEKGK